MKVTLSIQRFNPETDGNPHIATYDVEVEPTHRVLDALMDITQNQDGTLGYRRSCAHGVCGSDAMRINGDEKLACKTLFKDLEVEEGGTVDIEPMKHLAVQKDLMVDQTPFFEKYRSVQPFFIPKAEQPQHGEFVQSQEERALFDEATKCINCAACYSACPVLDKNPDFLGPQAIVAAARFVNDSRDQGLEPRLDVLDTPNGVWPCENHFRCTQVCPRDIKITKLINQTKRQIKKYREARGEQTAEERA
jgi:succinate dehydrogenase / fumarate reductase iron-sulfur subunit